MVESVVDLAERVLLAFISHWRELRPLLLVLLLVLLLLNPPPWLLLSLFFVVILLQNLLRALADLGHCCGLELL